jgi:hypothetical protein
MLAIWIVVFTIYGATYIPIDGQGAYFASEQACNAWKDLATANTTIHGSCMPIYIHQEAEGDESDDL